MQHLHDPVPDLYKRPDCLSMHSHSLPACCRAQSSSSPSPILHTLGRHPSASRPAAYRVPAFRYAGCSRATFQTPDHFTGAWLGSMGSRPAGGAPACAPVCRYFRIDVARQLFSGASDPHAPKGRGRFSRRAADAAQFMSQRPDCLSMLLTSLLQHQYPFPCLQSPLPFSAFPLILLVQATAMAKYTERRKCYA